MSEEFWKQTITVFMAAMVATIIIVSITECRKHEVENKCGVFSPCKG